MQEKPVIQLLSDQVINKIAAGEVVERPASVVKELLENALDAGATQVEVEVVRGGRQLIAITDNGCGMNRDQALLSIERHATSKIRSEADIERIGTLGFRGEALAAISSVSRFTLITRPAENLAGTEIQISGGKLLSVEEVGSPPGTRIEVRNLFFNVPARRKFLRAEQTELSHIRQLFWVHALAHPSVGMRLKVDGRTVIQLAPAENLKDRILELYNEGFAQQLLPVEHQTPACRVSGFAGLPQTGRKDRQDQYVFINGRPASAPVIYHAINAAYHALITKGRYPALFLFLEMDPEEVDVNVHPTKKEVRFRHPSAIRDAVLEALQNTLSPKQVSVEKEEENRTPEPLRPQAPRIERQREMDSILVRPEQILRPKPSLPAEATPASPPPAPPTSTSVDASTVSDSPWGWCKIVGRLSGLYVVLETEDGFVLMEPRAAHERVLFERFMQKIEQGTVARQGLLAPETVSLIPSDARIVREHLAALNELGFGVSSFGGDTFLVDALPAEVADQAAEPLLIEMARELEKVGKKRGAQSLVYERIAQTACQLAVRKKERLSDAEIERLVSDLAQTEMPYTSPRGRPTLIYTSFSELDRKFNRS